MKIPDPAREVVAYWRAAEKDWFSKSEAFDEDFRTRFLALHEAASRGELDDWQVTAEGALALLILLDQFPRNAFRDSPRMYATDALAREVAGRLADAGLDAQIAMPLRIFCYLPFAHSEALADQQRSVDLTRPLGKPWIEHAERHAGIVARFGRFPHRNRLLGRASTAEELGFLAAGGFAG